jgi:hypothetical protein
MYACNVSTRPRVSSQQVGWTFLSVVRQMTDRNVHPTPLVPSSCRSDSVKKLVARCSLVLLVLFSIGVAADAADQGVVWQVEEVVEIADVWAGHPVGFSLLTAPPHQFVAFYDAQRRMTVGMRRLDEPEFRLRRLPSPIEGATATAGRRLPTTQLGWDSHNGVTIALDPAGHLHLSGNMHCTPLLYFRAARPFDIDSLTWVPEMVGPLEDRVTYPRFIYNHQDALVFTYRHGSSGNGIEIFNIYDQADGRWRRLLDTPLFDGQGQRNAYYVGPVQDAEGVFHVCWVWRDTPDCATNHNVSYARSRDLQRWEDSAGQSLELPITLDRGDVVDPIPPGGGLINGNTRIGFDTQGRVIVTYHKHDEQGFTQIYNARREGDRWRIQQVTDWEYRWEFQGGGSIVFEIRVSPVEVASDGTLEQSYSHAKYGSGRWQICESTLRPIGAAPRRHRQPGEINRLLSDFPGMQVRRAGDRGDSGDPAVQYLLRWETLPANRDRPRPGDLPAPSALRLYKLSSK